MGTLSLWLRGYAELPERVREDIAFTVDAMLEISDESAAPVDWRQAAKTKHLVDEKIAGYRRARTAELRRRFEEGNGTATAMA